ncbi:MAG: hypothetical protein KME05_09290 [Gloeocapsa sp. UFS-A4-WI-NPMV-4B04]|jgi:hypothetical protein|nr:hypothetical protein [Gloeocapsa sp. UFS-A4-WI-NPMV-4B04]
MNLPVILDIAIGLIFVYLILSLLASEIQEFLATVLQWRAKNLKESIEILLAGDSKKKEDRKNAIKLANKLYSSPLIENISQEAKGQFVKLPREITWDIGKLYRSIKPDEERLISPETESSISPKIETVFGDEKHTGPSSIASETFATTLLEVLKIPTLAHKFTEAKLEAFKQKLLNSIKTSLLTDFNPSLPGMNENLFNLPDEQLNGIGAPTGRLLEGFNQVKQEYEQIIEDFKNNKATIELTINRMEERLNQYSSLSKTSFPPTDPSRITFDRNMDLLKERFGKNDQNEHNERNVLLRGMKPSLTQVVKALDASSEIHKQILEAIEDKDSPTCQKIAKEIETIRQEFNDLPESLKKSIAALADRAQSRVEIVETDINQLRQEIELWFDRSMERATGVYKRNAKGVAILIGFCIAFIINADAFYMVRKLATQEEQRNAIAQNAQAVYANCQTISTSSDAATEQLTATDAATPTTSAISTATSVDPALNCLYDETNKALDKVTLPVGWSANNLIEQWNFPYQYNRNNSQVKRNWWIWLGANFLLPITIFGLFISSGIKIIEMILQHPTKVLKSNYFWLGWLSIFTGILVVFTGVNVVLGWALSAIAISMGAPFWFDLLGKVVNVRNTGPKPVSSSDNQATSEDQRASTRSGT